jgi:hypothetical protein
VDGNMSVNGVDDDDNVDFYSLSENDSDNGLKE